MNSAARGLLTVATIVLAAYAAGRIAGSAYQSRRLSESEQALRSAFTGKPLAWRLDGTDGYRYDVDSASPKWKILLVGADGCSPCVEQQLAFLQHLRATSYRNSLELWIASSRFSLFDTNDSASNQLTVRGLRYMSLGPLQDYTSILPIALLIDPQGIVRDIKVGFSERKGLATLDQMLKAAGMR